MTNPSSLSHEIATALEKQFRFQSKAELGRLLRRAVDALRQQEWQPIETAPKNQRVLVLVPERGCFVIGVFTAKRVYSDNIDVDQWVFAGGGRIPTEPTHWQPLPALPSSGSEGR